MKHAILFTLSYHSRFSSPLTFDELHRFLVINRPLSSNEVKLEVIKLLRHREVALGDRGDLIGIAASSALGGLLAMTKSPNFFDLRLKRQLISKPKLDLAKKAAKMIGLLPWVKLICVTGSLAMENSDSGDDIDLMIVTAQNRLWLVRPFAILLISFFFKRRKPIPSSFVLRPFQTLCV